MAGRAGASKGRDLPGGGVEHLDLVVIGVGNEHAASGDRDPERMLQPRRIARAILITKLEQVAAGDGRHRIAGWQIERADDVGFGVGDIQRVAIKGEAGRLREGRGVDGTILPRLFAGAGVGIRAVVQQIDHPDLVRPCHRDDQDAGLNRQVPRRVEVNAHGLAPFTAPRALFAGAGHGVDRARWEIDDAHLVILGVGDIQLAVGAKHHSLRTIKPRLGEDAVVVALQARADGFNQLAIEGGHHNAVVIRVGDEQAARRLVCQHLARIQQRAVGVSRAFEIECQRRAVDLTLFIKDPHDRANGADEPVEVTLAHGGADEIAGRVDDHARRPGLHAVAAPDLVTGVVRDRMLDLVAHEDALEVLGVLLVRELGRVNADHDEFFGEALLERLQIPKNVHAVDAAVGPEVEDHDLATQLRQRHRRGDIQPRDRAVKTWCGNRDFGDRRFVLTHRSCAWRPSWLRPIGRRRASRRAGDQRARR